MNKIGLGSGVRTPFAAAAKSSIVAGSLKDDRAAYAALQQSKIRSISASDSLRIG